MMGRADSKPEPTRSVKFFNKIVFVVIYKISGLFTLSSPNLAQKRAVARSEGSSGSKGVCFHVSSIHSNVFLHIKIILHINFYLWSPNRICQISIFQLQWCKLVWKIKHLFKPNIFTQNGRTTLDNYYDMQGSNLLKCINYHLD